MQVWYGEHKIKEGSQKLTLALDPFQLNNYDKCVPNVMLNCVK
jgi:hypothetical protein